MKTNRAYMKTRNLQFFFCRVGSAKKKEIVPLPDLILHDLIEMVPPFFMLNVFL